MRLASPSLVQGTSRVFVTETPRSVRILVSSTLLLADLGPTRDDGLINIRRRKRPYPIYYIPKPYGWGRVRLHPGARGKGCPRGQETTEVAPVAKDRSYL